MRWAEPHRLQGFCGFYWKPTTSQLSMGYGNFSLLAGPQGRNLGQRGLPLASWGGTSFRQLLLVSTREVSEIPHQGPPRGSKTFFPGMRHQVTCEDRRNRNREGPTRRPKWVWKTKNWKLGARRDIQAPQQGPTRRCQSFQKPQKSARATLAAQVGKLNLREASEATGQWKGRGKAVCFLISFLILDLPETRICEQRL